MLTLYENPGWGSAGVEAQLAFYGAPHRLTTVGDVCYNLAARAALKKITPLAQLPTRVLDDGQIITESAAMTLLLADFAAQSRGPWFLGAQMTALHVFVMVMLDRSPRKAWCKVKAPRLSALAAHVWGLRAFAPVMQRNFR